MLFNLGLVSCLSKPNPKVPISILWRYSATDYVKLNVNGLFLGNLDYLDGGGVVWDFFGNVLFGFTIFFGIRSNMEAESLALLEGVQLCSECGLNHVEVETDSKTLALMLLGKTQVPWKLWRSISCIKDIALGKHFVFTHTFRVVNVVANALATLASSSKCYSIFSATQIHRDIIGLANLIWTPPTLWWHP